jgi:two-component system phosphate regulon sensor histidine kinase PhoR
MRPETIPLEIGGRDLWLSMSGVGVGDATVYAFRDLTEERAVEQMKSDFVATISHELRTPLAAIYGAAVTIRRPDLDLGDEMRDRLLGVIADESDRLAQIVNDVLLASHLDSGRLEVRIEACDGKEIARNVVEAAKAHLPEGVSLAFEAPKRLPKVAADAGQLQQILVNLLDNAIKYSPDGGHVELAMERAGNHLRFLVRDEGLGIPRTERNRIFEKFYRLDPHMTRGIGGTGLGLYIVRELVRRLEGRITVNSDEGKGSTFAVEIPVAQEATSSREKQAAQA